jgi:hypothetical protein
MSYSMSYGRVKTRRYSNKRLLPQKFGRRVLDAITPDRAEVRIGCPPPYLRAQVEWDREKKARITKLQRRLNL